MSTWGFHPRLCYATPSGFRSNNSRLRFFSRIDFSSAFLCDLCDSVVSPELRVTMSETVRNKWVHAGLFQIQLALTLRQLASALAVVKSPLRELAYFAAQDALSHEMLPGLRAIVESRRKQNLVGPLPHEQLTEFYSTLDFHLGPEDKEPVDPPVEMATVEKLVQACYLHSIMSGVSLPEPIHWQPTSSAASSAFLSMGFAWYRGSRVSQGVEQYIQKTPIEIEEWVRQVELWSHDRERIRPPMNSGRESSGVVSRAEVLLHEGRERINQWIASLPLPETKAALRIAQELFHDLRDDSNDTIAQRLMIFHTEWSRQLPEITDPLQRAFSSDDRTGPVGVKLSRLGRTKFALVLRLLDAADDLGHARTIPEPGTKLISNIVRDLTRTKSNVSAQLIREDSTLTKCIDRVHTPNDSPPRTAVTGLYFPSTDPHKEPVVIRRARVELPPEKHPAAMSADTLRKSLSASEPALAELCAELIQWIDKRSDMRPAIPPDDRPRLWRGLQRLLCLATVRPELSGPVTQLIHELRQGFAWEVFSLQKQEGNGIWSLMPNPKSTMTRVIIANDPDLGDAIGLRFPDGHVEPADVWLSVPEKLIQNRPLPACLIGNEAILYDLRRLEPDWPGWADYNREINLIAHSNGRDDSVSGLQLFELFFGAIEKYPGTREFRSIARRLYRELHRDLTTKIRPELDVESLHPRPLTHSQLLGEKIRWEYHDSPTGTILQIESFGSGPTPANLRVSLGREDRSHLRAWLDLPSPSFPGLDGDPAPMTSHPLVEWYLSSRTLIWEPASFREQRTDSARRSFVQWSQREPGASWLDRFAKSLRLQGDHPSIDAARQWWKVLDEIDWLTVFPTLDVDSGEVRWTGEWSPEFTGIRWEYDEGLRGSNLGGELFFSVDPKSAKGMFSLGPREPNGILEVAEEIRTVGQRITSETGWQKILDKLVGGAHNQRVSMVSLDAEKIVLPLLDAFVPIWQTQESVPEVREFLRRLREWCRLQNIVILPDENVPAETLVEELHPKFLPGTKPGDRKLERFGLILGTDLIRSPDQVISAGSPPVGFNELQALIAESDDERIRDLQRFLDEWPMAAIGRKLDDLLTDLFASSWNLEPRAGVDQLSVEVRAIVQTITGMLHYEGIEEFRPKKLNDPLPGAVDYDQNIPRRSDKVRRVLRPGLIDRDNNILLKAKVELE